MDQKIAEAKHELTRYQPRGSALRLQSATEQEIILTGPRGTGKSRGALEKLWAVVSKYPHARGAIVRKTRASLTTSGLVTFERDVLGDNHPLIVSGPRRENRSNYLLPNGSEIVVAGLDKPERLLSTEYDIIFVQQAEEATVMDWETCLGTLRSFHAPYQQLIGDCNPESPLHWIKQRAEKGTLELWETYHKDNPVMWDEEAQQWTPQGEKYLATLDKYTGTRKLRYRYGKWVAPEGAIYDVYDEERHLVKAFDIPAQWPRFVGIDPFGARIAAIWGALEPNEHAPVLHIYREYLEPFGVTTPQHVANILELSRNENIFIWVGGGPSERQARTDWMAAGIPLQAPPITDVWAQIDRVYQLFAADALVIHDSCPQTISDVTALRRKQNTKTGEFTETIENKDDYHLADALRYLIAWLVDAPEEPTVVYRPYGGFLRG